VLIDRVLSCRTSATGPVPIQNPGQAANWINTDPGSPSEPSKLNEKVELVSNLAFQGYSDVIDSPQFTVDRVHSGVNLLCRKTFSPLSPHGFICSSYMNPVMRVASNAINGSFYLEIVNVERRTTFTAHRSCDRRKIARDPYELLGDAPPASRGVNGRTTSRSSFAKSSCDSRKNPHLSRRRVTAWA